MTGGRKENGEFGVHNPLVTRQLLQRDKVFRNGRLCLLVLLVTAAAVATIAYAPFYFYANGSVFLLVIVGFGGTKSSVGGWIQTAMLFTTIFGLFLGFAAIVQAIKNEIPDNMHGVTLFGYFAAVFASYIVALYGGSLFRNLLLGLIPVFFTFPGGVPVMTFANSFAYIMTGLGLTALVLVPPYMFRRHWWPLNSTDLLLKDTAVSVRLLNNAQHVLLSECTSALSNPSTEIKLRNSITSSKEATNPVTLENTTEETTSTLFTYMPRLGTITRSEVLWRCNIVKDFLKLNEEALVRSRASLGESVFEPWRRTDYALKVQRVLPKLSRALDNLRNHVFMIFLQSHDYPWEYEEWAVINPLFQQFSRRMSAALSKIEKELNSQNFEPELKSVNFFSSNSNQEYSQWSTQIDTEAGAVNIEELFAETVKSFDAWINESGGENSDKNVSYTLLNVLFYFGKLGSLLQEFESVAADVGTSDAKRSISKAEWMRLWAAFKGAMTPHRYYAAHAKGELRTELLLAFKPTFAIAIGLLWLYVPYLHDGLSKNVPSANFAFVAPMTVGLIWSDEEFDANRKMLERAIGTVFGAFLTFMYAQYIPNYPWSVIIYIPICLQFILVARFLGKPFVETAASASFVIVMYDGFVYATAAGYYDLNSQDARQILVESVGGRVNLTVIGILVVFVVQLFFFPITGPRKFYSALGDCLHTISQACSESKDFLSNILLEQQHHSSPDSTFDETSKTSGREKAENSLTKHIDKSYAALNLVRENGRATYPEYTLIAVGFPKDFSGQLAESLSWFIFGMEIMGQLQKYSGDLGQDIVQKILLIHEPLSEIFGEIEVSCSEAISHYFIRNRLLITDFQPQLSLLTNRWNDFASACVKRIRKESESSKHQTERPAVETEREDKLKFSAAFLTLCYLASAKLCVRSVYDICGVMDVSSQKRAREQLNSETNQSSSADKVA